MLRHENNHSLLGRRDFILAALLFPFLVRASMTYPENTKGGSLSTDKNAEFVILGGWVFLKSDLIGNQG
jgi:hypothetical protein